MYQVESDKIQGNLSGIIGSYVSRWCKIRYRVIFSRRIGIDKGGGRIRFRGILSRRVGIDACGGGCIRFRDNRSRSIGRDGSGNSWVGFRGNRCRIVVKEQLLLSE